MPDNDESPPTLASLRAMRGGVRRGASRERPARTGEAESADLPQPGLLFAEPTLTVASSVVDRPMQMPARTLPVGGAILNLIPDGSLGAVPGAGGPADAGETSEETVALPVVQKWVERRQAETLPAAAEHCIWSVRSIVSDVRQRLELGYREVWVEGEISTCRPAASGHLYLTLKDGEAQLATVLFRRQAQLLRFKPATGMAVLVRGRVSVYEGRGELQLIAETIEPRGAGAQLVAFEQLKARLRGEGLFAAERKRSLPAFPRCVGVVTSTGGAVLHDIVTVVRRRHARLNLLVYPALMQGPGCAASVMAGLRWFNRHPDRVELILVARGGGSPEDLQGFNDEALARAIAASALPVISAVGHETDFTIADFVADLRAPTPSAAAELMTESQHRIEERLERLRTALERAARYRMLEARQRFARSSAEAVLRTVHAGLDRRQQRADDLGRRLKAASDGRLRGLRRRLEVLTARLERQDAGRRLAQSEARLRVARERLERAGRMVASRGRVLLDRTAGRLEALSPLAVLARGYALVYDLEASEAGEAGQGSGHPRLISSSTETRPGRRIRARLAQGSFQAEVTEIDGE